MKPIVLGCTGLAMALGLSACGADYKATDKLMRNDHRIIQNTRIYQQPAKITRVPVQMPSTVRQTIVRQQPAVQQVIQPVIQQVAQPIVQEIVEPVVQQIETKVVAPQVITKMLEPTIRTVYVDAPTVTTARTINIRTLPRIRILELQRALSSEGLYRAPIDGIFGIRTAQALAAYQRQIGTTGPVTVQVLEGLGIIL